MTDFDELDSDGVKALPAALSFEDFQKLVLPFGREIEKQTGIFFAIPIVQAAHESNFGNSGLSRKGMNLFGIKATESWTRDGRPVVEMGTWEFAPSNRQKAFFRAYRSWWESFQNWAEVITRVKLYGEALELMKKGAPCFAEAVTAMGQYYATDPNYAGKLIRLYEMSQIKKGG